MITTSRILSMHSFFVPKYLVCVCLFVWRGMHFFNIDSIPMILIELKLLQECKNAALYFLFWKSQKFSTIK
jgi:hypothetical protein